MLVIFIIYKYSYNDKNNALDMFVDIVWSKHKFYIFFILTANSTLSD